MPEGEDIKVKHRQNGEIGWEVVGKFSLFAGSLAGRNYRLGVASEKRRSPSSRRG